MYDVLHDKQKKQITEKRDKNIQGQFVWWKVIKTAQSTKTTVIEFVSVCSSSTKLIKVHFPTTEKRDFLVFVEMKSFGEKRKMNESF